VKVIAISTHGISSVLPEDFWIGRRVHTCHASCIKARGAGPSRGSQHVFVNAAGTDLPLLPEGCRHGLPGCGYISERLFGALKSALGFPYHYICVILPGLALRRFLLNMNNNSINWLQYGERSDRLRLFNSS